MAGGRVASQPGGLSRERCDLGDPDDLDDYDRRSAPEIIPSLTERIRAQAEALGIPVDGLYAPPGYDPAEDPAARPLRTRCDSDDGEAQPHSPKQSRGPPSG